MACDLQLESQNLLSRLVTWDGFLAWAFGTITLIVLTCLAQPNAVEAQQVSSNSTTYSVSSDSPPHGASSDSSDAGTIFPHPENSRYWISGQANFIFQWHPPFAAKYTGINSLSPKADSATSELYDVYLGYKLMPTTEVVLNLESAGGHGISNALGLSGFTNLDVQRNALGPSPYVAQFMLRQIIPLGDARTEAERGPFGLATSLPARRIEIRVGKFSVVDFFDVNSWGSDSHFQFLNWSVDSCATYDYGANTRGYTDAVMIEYDDDWWSARFAEALMPKIANGINLDADVARAREENLEIAARGGLIRNQFGIVRLLGYVNHANMGNYRQAIADYLGGETPAPDIVFTRRQGRRKYGFELNFEQKVARDIGFFGRLGWSDGRNESFVYTETDRTLELGGFSGGTAWHREYDRAGIAFVTNAIVSAHQEYLALGGLGLELGDGGLNYGQEKIVEGFYTAHVWRGFFTSFDIQHINNPGYNKDRGPIIVPGLRLHVEF